MKIRQFNQIITLMVMFTMMMLRAMNAVAAEAGVYTTNRDMQLFTKDDMYSKLVKLIPRGSTSKLDKVSNKGDNMQHVTSKIGQGWIRLDESDLKKIN